MKARLVVGVVFVLSRLTARAFGVRFDGDTVETHWQFLDARLLESDLATSLWNLHSQPPAMNALYGVVAKLSPADNGRVIAWLLFALFGLVAAMLVYELASRLGDRRVACIVACLFTISPAAILFENVLFYPHLVMVGLCGAAYALERSLATGRVRWIAILFGIVAAVALTRSTYHLLWVVGVGVGVTFLVPAPARRWAAIAATVAFLTVGAWYVKNLALVGKFTASTWAGMSVAKSTSNAINDAQFERLLRDGTVTPLFAIPPFSPLERYSNFVTPPTEGHPAVAARTKTNGTTNYNNGAYVVLSDLYLRDAVQAIRAEPVSVLEGQIDSWSMYFQPSSQYHRFIGAVFSRTGYHRANVVAAAPAEIVWNSVVGLQVGEPPTDDELLRYGRPEMRTRRIATVSWTSVIGTIAIVALVPLALVRGRRAGLLDREQVIVAVFCLANILYVAIVCNAIEVGENQRFKFETEALWWILVAMLVSWAVSNRPRFLSRER